MRPPITIIKVIMARPLPILMCQELVLCEDTSSLFDNCSFWLLETFSDWSGESTVSVIVVLMKPNPNLKISTKVITPSAQKTMDPTIIFGFIFIVFVKIEIQLTYSLEHTIKKSLKNDQKMSKLKYDQKM